MTRIGVVFNANTRRHRKVPAGLDEVRRALGGGGSLRVTRTRDDVGKVTHDFAEDGVDLLGIVGGDGTNHLTLGAVLDAYGGRPLPRIVLLPGGTMNTAALSVGMTRRPAGEQLSAIARAVREGARLRTTRRHLLRVGDGVGFLFGTGIVAGYLREYYDRGAPSPFTAAATLTHAIASALRGGAMLRRMARPFRAALTLDGAVRWDLCDYLTVVAATIDQIGLGFRPFPRYAERPGRFQILGITGSPLGLVAELPRVRMARPMRETRARTALVETAALESQEPFRYTVDGELLECSGKLTLAIGPALEIVVAPDRG